ncbi:hypothetical protein BH23ACT2_BH23ACT2_09850 [soil metagenome]
MRPGSQPVVLVLGWTVQACGGGGAVIAGADNGADPASNDEIATVRRSVGLGEGEPLRLLADELHDVELPEPGMAVIGVAGATYLFDQLETCVIISTSDSDAFEATGSTETDDGRVVRFVVQRSVAHHDRVTGGGPEVDGAELSIEEEPGTNRFSTMALHASRERPGSPVEGDVDRLPITRVVDAGSAILATAAGPVDFLPVGDHQQHATGEVPLAVAVQCAAAGW